jgi:acyl dehydratase
MTDWAHQVCSEDVQVGNELPPVTMPITLQRLVMEAGANRDLSLIHHDRDVARSTGAPDAYMSTYFILGMIERLLREWMGVRGTIKKIGALRMTQFNSVGDVVTFKGVVRELTDDAGAIIDVTSETERGTTVTATATVLLPAAPNGRRCRPDRSASVDAS